MISHSQCQSRDNLCTFFSSLFFSFFLFLKMKRDARLFSKSNLYCTVLIIIRSESLQYPGTTSTVAINKRKVLLVLLHDEKALKSK